MKSLSPEQQAALVAQAKTNNPRAQRELLAYCERDIRAIVAKVKCAAADREDLAQVARIAIMKAVQTFDAQAGMQFRFYAAQWAREDVRREAVKLPSVVARGVRHRRLQDVSLDAPTSGEESDDLSLLDVLESEAPSPEDSVITDSEAERLRQVLERVIQRLKEDAERRYQAAARRLAKEAGESYDAILDKLMARVHTKHLLCRDVVYSRLLSHDPVKLETLSQRYGVARETVRKVEVAILKMAKFAANEG